MSNSTEQLQCTMKMRTPRVSNGQSHGSSGEEVRTLFVSGLPMDVRLRELYLLFRSYEGYEGSFLKLISSKPGKPPQPIAFVSFDTRKQAEKALDELQGIHFDPTSAQTLRLEFARTNSRVSPKQQQSYISQQSVANAPGPLPNTRNGQYVYYIVSNGSHHLAPGGSGGCLPTTAAAVGTMGQNVLTLADCWAPTRMHNNMVPSVSYTNPTTTLSPASSTAHLSVMSILSDSESSCNIQDQYGNVYCYYPPMYSILPQMNVAISAYPTPVSTPDLDEQRHSPEVERLKGEDVVPSSLSPTLSVGNIKHQATEDEISSVFSSCPGFVKLSLIHQNGGNCQTALVEFTDADCAKAAMIKLHGSSFEWIKNGTALCIESVKQDSQDTHLSSAMECSCSPPSSNETLSPPNTLSPKHQTAHPHFSPLSPVSQQRQYPPATEKFCHPSPHRVHVATQGETDDSAVLLPRPINPAAIPSMAYASPNLKQLSSAPSFIYPGAGPLMNQHVLQPMWH